MPILPSEETLLITARILWGSVTVHLKVSQETRIAIEQGRDYSQSSSADKEILSAEQ